MVCENLLVVLKVVCEKGVLVFFDLNVCLKLWDFLDEVCIILSGFLFEVDIVMLSFDDEILCWGDVIIVDIFM